MVCNKATYAVGVERLYNILDSIDKKMLFSTIVFVLIILIVVGYYCLTVKKHNLYEGNMARYTVFMAVVLVVVGAVCFVKWEKVYDKYKAEHAAMDNMRTDITESLLGITCEQGEAVCKKPQTLYIYLYFYNYYYDDDLTYEEILKQYENFCQDKRKSTYEDFVKLTDVMYDEKHQFYTITSNRVYAPYFVTACEAHMPEDYNDNPEWTDEKVDDVCNKVMESIDQVYLRYMSEDFINHIIGEFFMRDDAKCYDFFTTDFSEGEVYELESGEKVVEYRGTVHYLKEGYLNYVTKEKVWYVYKIQIDENSEQKFLYGSIGQDKEYNKKGFDKGDYSVFRKYDFPIVSETENQIVREMDGMRLIQEYEDGLCVKISLEITR